MADGFGLDNLPYGAVCRPGTNESTLCVRLGDDAIDLGALAGELGCDPHLVNAPNLDRLLAAPPEAWQEVRDAVRARLADEVPPETRIALADARCVLPFTVRDYVDFYSSLEHATNLGRMFRPDAEPLLPNWRHVPIGYHGRSSTVVPSGTPIARPHGQLPLPDGPVFGPSERLDIELELGFVTGGRRNALGEPIPIAEAGSRIFGFVLVNDWSARDIQRWEYVPLGPFLGKSFATSISPWVVTLDALDPFRVAGPVQDPAPLPYLRTHGERNFNIDLEVWLKPESEAAPMRVCVTNFGGMYWNMCQQLAHLTTNGTNLRVGDLCGSGTVSGPEPGSFGSMLEIC